MKRVISQLIITLISFSCVEPIDLALRSEEAALVVEGVITNQRGPYTVKIGRSLPFDNTQILPAYFKPEKNASVSIYDNTGDFITLTETEPGLYETSINFRGKIGNFYTLKIKTQDGNEYESDSEVLVDVPVIDTLTYGYTLYSQLIVNASGNHVEVTRTGFTLSVTFSDPPDQRNFYRWKVSGIFEYYSDFHSFNHCWALLPRLESHILLYSDHYFNGKSRTEELAIIPYERPTYFLATVEQYSLTEKAYEFWKKLKEQQLATGTIFDTVPTYITGNIKNVNDPNEDVFGYFAVSALECKSVLIHRLKASDYVSPYPYIQPFPGDCRTQFPNATDQKPPGFP